MRARARTHTQHSILNSVVFSSLVRMLLRVLPMTSPSHLPRAQVHAYAFAFELCMFRRAACFVIAFLSPPSLYLSLSLFLPPLSLCTHTNASARADTYTGSPVSSEGGLRGREGMRDSDRQTNREGQTGTDRPLQTETKIGAEGGAGLPAGRQRFSSPAWHRRRRWRRRGAGGRGQPVRRRVLAEAEARQGGKEKEFLSSTSKKELRIVLEGSMSYDVETYSG